MAKSQKIRRKGYRIRWGNVAIVSGVFLLLLAVLILLGMRGCKRVGPENGGVDLSSETENVVSQETSKEEEVPEPTRVHFVSVGDNLIHSNVYLQAKKRGGDHYDFTFAYEKIASIVGEADIATINQETIIDPEREPSSYPQFNSPVELGDEIERIGFDVVTVANNHMLDCYETGLRNALTYWQAKEGIVTTGAYLNETQMNQVEQNEHDGVTFGYLGVTQYTNGLSLPEGSELRYISTEETDLIKQKIEAAAAVCDVVVVNAHWGNEYSYEPTDAQRTLAKQMVEWGADVIIGHHPHVLQPMEYMEKPDGGQALVVYSLGNFISAQDMAPRVVGGMVNYDVVKDHETGVITVENAVFEPLITHYGYGFSNIQVIPYSQYSEDLAKAHGIRGDTPEFSLTYIQDLVKSVIPEEFIKVF